MEKKLKIDLISDTHTQHNKLTMSGGDILICAGDISYRGTNKEILEFLTWFSKLPYEYLIFTPGNHDFGFEREFEEYAKICKKLDIFLLNDTGITVEGIKVWGSPVQPWFHDWSFNRQRGADIKRHWDLIPEDTEILVTHGPPRGILDITLRNGEHVGCDDLMDKILKTQVKLHIFGHIHEGRGHKYQDGRVFVNAAILDGRYQMVTGKPITVVKDLDNTYLVENETVENNE